jgi:excisionase family DNA binding protein
MEINRPSDQAMKNLYKLISRLLPRYIDELNEIKQEVEENINKFSSKTISVEDDQIPFILSVKDAAQRLGISTPTLMRRINEKKIKAYKEGGHWKIKREWIAKYQNELLKEAGFEEEDVPSEIQFGKLKPIRDIRIVSEFLENDTDENGQSKYPSITVKCKDIFAFLEEGSEYVVILPVNDIK